MFPLIIKTMVLRSTRALARAAFIACCAVLVLGETTQASGAAVTKISWDSKAKYNRFILQFDEYLKFNAVDAVKDKGYFYIDVYGLTTNYKRRLLAVNDNTVKYVDAVCYPEHKVLRLVFYTKDLSCAFRVSRTGTPARIIVDTVKDATINIEPAQFKTEEVKVGSMQASAGVAAGGSSIQTNMDLSGAGAGKQEAASVPPIPEPRTKPLYIASGKKKVIIIDAGHGGANSGTSGVEAVTGRRVSEKELTLQFAYHLKKVIDQSPNMIALLTRSDDSNVSLEERVRFAESHQGDFFISLHMNDGDGNPNARGVEIYFLDEKGTVSGAAKAVAERENMEVGKTTGVSKGTAPLLKSILTDLERGKLEDWQYESWVICKRLQESLQDVPYYRQFNRGIKSNNFVVLKNFAMPAVLLEAGFMTSKEDLKYLINPQFQQATAVTIYNALNNYFAECDPGFNSQTINVSKLISR